MKATDSAAAISRSEAGAFLSFTIVQFIFDCEFKVRLSLDSPGARRIGMPRLHPIYFGTAEVPKCSFVLSPIAVGLTSSLLSALWPLPTRSAKVRNPPN